MADKIIHKQSSVAEKVPLPGDLLLGELAVNAADGKVYLKKTDGTVVQLGVYPDDLGTLAYADGIDTPFINMMPDGGRGGGVTNPLEIEIGEDYVYTPFFQPFNGATGVAQAKFYNDNSTNGGPRSALTEPITRLLYKCDRYGGDARFGKEFIIPTLQAGNGSSQPSVGTDSVTRYIVTTCEKAVFSSNQKATFVGWVRVRDGTGHIRVPYFLNGVLVPAGTPFPDAEFHHVRVVEQSTRGVVPVFPYVSTTKGALVDVAMPAFFSGEVDVGMHTTPMITINVASE